MLFRILLLHKHVKISSHIENDEEPQSSSTLSINCIEESILQSDIDCKCMHNPCIKNQNQKLIHYNSHVSLLMSFESIAFWIVYSEENDDHDGDQSCNSYQ